jgi:hypothetical protein
MESIQFSLVVEITGTVFNYEEINKCLSLINA